MHEPSNELLSSVAKNVRLLKDRQIVTMLDRLRELSEHPTIIAMFEREIRWRLNGKQSAEVAGSLTLNLSR